MNHDQLEIKAAEALMAALTPGAFGADYEARMRKAHRLSAAIVIDAVEADIRADERRRIVTWLRTERSDALSHPLTSNDLASEIEKGIPS